MPKIVYHPGVNRTLGYWGPEGMYPYDNMLMNYGDKNQFTSYGTMFINDTVVNGLHPYLFLGNGTILDGWMETGNDTTALNKVCVEAASVAAAAVHVAVVAARAVVAAATVAIAATVAAAIVVVAIVATAVAIAAAASLVAAAAIRVTVNPVIVAASPAAAKIRAGRVGRVVKVNAVVKAVKAVRVVKVVEKERARVERAIMKATAVAESKAVAVARLVVSNAAEAV
ncbi:hypothetical protein GGI24_004074, partial [Coemansia furcata]